MTGRALAIAALVVGAACSDRGPSRSGERRSGVPTSARASTSTGPVSAGAPGPRPTLATAPALATDDEPLAEARRADVVAVRRALDAHAAELVGCARPDPATPGRPADRIAVRLTLDADGKLTGAQATGFDGDVAACVAARLRSVPLPAPDSGEPLVVGHTLRLPAP